MTLMERWGEHEEDLHITVTMPSLEVGTVGGGTSLQAQAACLNMLNVKGESADLKHYFVEPFGHQQCELKLLCYHLDVVSYLFVLHIPGEDLSNKKISWFVVS